MSQDPVTAGTGLAVPELCLGKPPAIRRRLPRLGRVFAARFRASGDFPALELVDMNAETLVQLNPTAADLFDRSALHIYFLLELPAHILGELEEADAERVWAAFEAALLGTPWGALALAVADRRPDSLASLRSKVDALARFWESLRPLRYVDFHPTPVSLAEIMRMRFKHLLAMWLETPSDSLQRDLQTALRNVEQASPSARLERAVQLVAALAQGSPRLREKATLTDPEFLRRELVALPAAEREAIEVGCAGPAQTLLYGMDRLLSSDERRPLLN